MTTAACFRANVLVFAMLALACPVLANRCFQAAQADQMVLELSSSTASCSTAGFILCGRCPDHDAERRRCPDCID